eukprot:TRINITY_DN358_c8_g1_i1.p1 TRINITY_DN358_c8_g1~~TRINITY_DN358_c8_g1_i1.p1  ORF type:complete len:118 (+),score=7.74 TRINITY_DN358_c8_g1_i1:341-694(+)
MNLWCCLKSTREGNNNNCNNNNDDIWMCLSRLRMRQSGSLCFLLFGSPFGFLFYLSVTFPSHVPLILSVAYSLFILSLMFYCTNCKKRHKKKHKRSLNQFGMDWDTLFIACSLKDWK